MTASARRNTEGSWPTNRSNLGCNLNFITFHLIKKSRSVMIVALFTTTICILAMSFVGGSQTNGLGSDEIDQKCSNCKLVSQSMEDLVNRPRTMDNYGKMSDRIDLDKIKNTICRDILEDADRQNCREFYFNNQKGVKKWKEANTKASFFDYICIKELKYCCPRNSFGPKCSKCIECGPNEHCHGEGYRSGSGKCVCKKGHSGVGCRICQPGYFMNKNSSTKISSPAFKNKVVCTPCHKSCVHCSHEGPLGCNVCREGFTWVSSYGCSDIDECIKDSKICGPNTFCVNTEGSYYCYECDKACNGCDGDGPDMCLKCADGYKLEASGSCEVINKTVLTPEANYYSPGWHGCGHVYRSVRVRNEQRPNSGNEPTEIILNNL